jgi:hypothetical protein
MMIIIFLLNLNLTCIQVMSAIAAGEVFQRCIAQDAGTHRRARTARS